MLCVLFAKFAPSTDFILWSVKGVFVDVSCWAVRGRTDRSSDVCEERRFATVFAKSGFFLLTACEFMWVSAFLQPKDVHMCLGWWPVVVLVVLEVESPQGPIPRRSDLTATCPLWCRIFPRCRTWTFWLHWSPICPKGTLIQCYMVALCTGSLIFLAKSGWKKAFESQSSMAICNIYNI